MKKILRLIQRLKNNSGSALVEFALVMPILILLVSGIFEISMFALINNKLVRISGTLSNVISMQNITPVKLMAIMETSDEMAKPLSFLGRGGVVVSQVFNNGKTTDPANMEISWQYATGSYVSKLGSAGSRPNALPNGLQILEDESIIITEVFYTYTPYVFTGFIPNQEIYKISIYVPRLGDMTTLLE
ncbi:MAG: pilus assembly protein [Alphaproteobacteria bacterium]|nr:pilus assembly protein [Alphaproteobacteria bacterium]